MSQHCSKSQYATFEAMNGKVFTIRLANHNTKVSNFDNLEESEGFVVTHNEYNKIKDKNKYKSDIASKILAQSQKSKLCIVFENTKKMEDNYIIHQIELYRKYLRDKDSKVERLIVVNNGGDIKHFHI